MRRASFLFLLSPTLLLSLPQNFQLTQGEASLELTSNTLSITASDRAILEWSDFSIEENETARFLLPDARASVLNRVIEANPSRLLGKLEANGRVLLINPNGVLVGADAQIDTGAFLASSLDILDSAFLDGQELCFSGTSEAPIAVHGKISASDGEIFLIGRHLEHHGSLAAETDAGLIASSSALLRPKDHPRIAIRSETLASDADNFFSYAFHRNEQEGAETTALLSGKIHSSGRQITVLGSQILLQDTALLDASHDAAGGTILIGGDYQGKNPEIRNALQVLVSPGASLDASSTHLGNGGKIVIWGDEAVGFYGSAKAEAGPQGGDGGLIEVSSPHLLAFEGRTSTFAPYGRTGTLLLDPINLTIGAASNAQVTTTPAGPMFTLAVPNAVGATLGAGALAIALASNNVIVTTVGSPTLGAGDITVSTAVIWNSANTLTLNSARDILISANILNGPAMASVGGVTLDAVRDISIGSASVGSLQGLTQATAGRNIRLQTTAARSTSQIGYLTVNGDIGRGAINVVCVNLDMLGGGLSGSAAQIGHGDCRGVFPPLGPPFTQGEVNSSTTNTATITVNASGYINLNSTVAGSPNITIGHGSRQYDPSSITSANQNGNITVTSGNNITLVNPLGGSGMTRIGHGFFTRGFLGDTFFPTMSGNISVTAAGAISLDSSLTTVNCVNLIGHGGGQRFFSSTITSDIFVRCCGNLALNGNAAGTSQSVGIGALYFTPPPNSPSVTQNITVQTGGNLLMTSRQRTFIGNNFQCGTGTAVYTGDIAVIAGGSITMETYTGEVLIGVRMQGAQIAGDFDNSNLFVASGSGGIALTIFAPPATTCIADINAGGNVCVAAGGAGGNITLNPNGLAGNSGDIYIGTYNLANAIAPVPVSTRIFATGDITATNGANGLAILGYSLEEVVIGAYNIDIRAGGDIQLAVGTDANKRPDPGTIFIEADSRFLPSALWTYAGGTMTQVCGIAHNQTVPITNACLPAPINTTSPLFDADGIGGFTVNSAVPPAYGGNITLETINGTPTTGAITINSACQLANPHPLNPNGNASNITVGGPAENLTITTDNGNITLSGSICGNSFRNVTLNAGIANPWTDGSIEARSCEFLEVNTQIATSGAGSSILMIADNDLDGFGDLNINVGGISTTSGPISLSAGLHSATCGVPNICTGFNASTANINHAAGTVVQCLLSGGTITETASGSIQINDATVQTIDGAIHMLAGIDININSTIQNIAVPLVGTGEIILVAGQDINLLANDSVVFSPNAVTLVADNDFPAPSLYGPGRITMVSGSSISGSAVQLYTALQSQNVLGGSLNSQSFSNGTLFEDTSLEQWCTYFNCPAQRAGLGIPYTVFYKNCFPNFCTSCACLFSCPPQEFLFRFQMNDHPGWLQQFYLVYRSVNPKQADINFEAPHFLRRRSFHLLNQPKTWTGWLSEPRLQRESYQEFYDESL